MKKLLILLFCFVLCFSACGETTSDQIKKEPASSSEEVVPEESEAPVEVENLDNALQFEGYDVKVWTNSIGTTWAQIFVRANNVSQHQIYLDTVSADLETLDGKLVATQNYINAYPQIIGPGESAYYCETIMLDSAPEGELNVLWHLAWEKAVVENIQFPVTDITISDTNYGSIKAIGRVENITDIEQSSVKVSIILFDNQKLPIGHMFTYVDIASGDKVGFECTGISLPSDVTAEDVASYIAVAFVHQYQF